MIMDGCQGKPRTPTIREKTCPVCGNTIEIFSTDTQVTCDVCGFVAYNDALSCVQWCQYARKCVGDEMYERMMEIARRQKAESAKKELSVAEKKQALRRKVRTMERILPQTYRDSAAAAICQRVTELPEYEAAKTVFAYMGTDREINTTALLQDVLNRGKTLCLPRCGREHTMALCRVETLEQLAPGAYGILEPVESCGILTPEEIDLTVTPCLTCDRQGNRLGQGGGYYDRFFGDYQGPAVLLCREKLMAEEVPVEAHDRRFDLLVTENAVYRL